MAKLCKLYYYIILNVQDVLLDKLSDLSENDILSVQGVRKMDRQTATIIS